MLKMVPVPLLLWYISANLVGDVVVLKQEEVLTFKFFWSKVFPKIIVQ